MRKSGTMTKINKEMKRELYDNTIMNYGVYNAEQIVNC